MNFINKNNSKLTLDEMERYSRHLVLTEIGETGQVRLKNSSVICIGCGGLGSPLLIYLAAAGVGNIGIVDCDLVDKSNLQRQIIHGTKSIGKPKIDSAKSRILEINPHCNVKTFNTALTNKNALKILKEFDVICDCTDNFASRYLINDASTILGKPIIYGAISKFEGQATVFNLHEDSPNFRDLIPEPPPQELLPTCSEAGVMGVLPGLIGLIQATETIKIITGVGESLDGRLIVFDALKMQFRELKLTRNNERSTITNLINYEDFCSQGTYEMSSIKSISISNLHNIITNNNSNILIIDVRDTYEYKTKSIKNSVSFPLKNIKNGKDIEKIKNMAFNKKVYTYCKTGGRSVKAILILKRYGIDATNILGGIESWNKQYP